MTPYKTIKDLLTAFSLANLCFISVWRAVIFPPFNGYHLPSPPAGVNDLAIMLDVLLLTATIWLSYWFAEHSEKTFFIHTAKIAFLLLVAIAFNNVIREIYNPSSFTSISAWLGTGLTIALALLMVIVAALGSIKFPRQILRAAQVSVLLLLPFAIVTFFDAGIGLAQDHFRVAANSFTQSEMQTSSAAKGPRVIWIIFDEFEYNAAFPGRPPTLQLPELDRFADESLFATNAFSPAKSTFRSLPALLSGRLIADANPKSFDTLAVRFADEGNFTNWSDQPNIFSRLKSEGSNSAIAGWYHPYCRILGRSPIECFDQTNFPDAYPNKHSSDLGTSMVDYFWRFGLTLPLVKEFLPKFKDYTPNYNFDRSHIEAARNVQAHALEMVANPKYSLVMIHFPAPHPPYFYSRHTHDFDPSTKSSYFDNLALVDDVLGSIRQTMEEHDLWNSSVVIVSADHWWRDEDRKENGVWAESETETVGQATDFRIPFIIKTLRQSASEEKQFSYDGVFNTVLTQDLILAMHHGEVTNASQIAEWLDQHRSGGKTDY